MFVLAYELGKTIGELRGMSNLEYRVWLYFLRKWRRDSEGPQRIGGGWQSTLRHSSRY